MSYSISQPETRGDVGNLLSLKIVDDFSTTVTNLDWQSRTVRRPPDVRSIGLIFRSPSKSFTLVTSFLPQGRGTGETLTEPTRKALAYSKREARSRGLKISARHVAHQWRYMERVEVGMSTQETYELTSRAERWHCYTRWIMVVLSGPHWTCHSAGSSCLGEIAPLVR